ncbi:hypothetical protein JNUCC0626_48785 [Lentzea sp. JNUCC 0626]|uniref:RipA family octameric membrane protein n=1 Tax=Lentzea sp. JNUCC 0626 TaxID=3367513 RepID=UPI003747A19B
MRPAAKTEPDVPVQVALAEYQHLRELRRQIIDRSNSRFNFFLIVVSAAATSVTAMLATNTSGSSRLLPALLLSCGVFLLGVMMFTRLVKFRAVQDEYTTALNTIRSFLVQLCPEVGKYFFLPTVEEQVAAGKRTKQDPRAFGSYGLAESVALVNGIVGGFTAGLALVNVRSAPAWLLVIVGAAMSVISILVQLRHVRSTRVRSKVRLDARLKEKGFV